MSRSKLPATRRLRIKADFVVEFDREIAMLPMHPRELLPKMMTAAGEALAPHGAQHILSAPLTGYVGRDNRRPEPTAVRLTFARETPKKRHVVSPFWWVVKVDAGYLTNAGRGAEEQQLARQFVSRRRAKQYAESCMGDARVVRVKARSRCSADESVNDAIGSPPWADRRTEHERVQRQHRGLAQEAQTPC